jgi:hypothetical protein
MGRSEKHDDLDRLLGSDYREPGPPPVFARHLESRLVDELRRQKPARSPARWFSSPLGRVAAIAAAAVVVAAFGIGLWLRAERHERQVEIARLQSEMSVREAELQLRTAGVKRLMVIERRRNVEERLALIHLDPAPLEQVAAERERAAATMVATADRMYRVLNLPASAIEKYRRAADLFPGTRGAVTATERLSEIQPG